MFSAAHSCQGRDQLRQRQLLVHKHVCMQHPFGLFPVLLQGNTCVQEALDIPIHYVHMTFTPSALANAFTHTHIPSTFGTTFGTNNEAQHMQCSTLFRESDLETRLQVGQHCVCDGANRLSARVCATRCRILLPGASVTASRGVRASAV